MISEAVIISVNLKIGNPGNLDAVQMDVLQGENEIKWHLAVPNSLEAKCTFNGREILPPLHGICSRTHKFSSSETIHPGMKAQLCSTDIEGTRTTTINALKAPIISMRINNQVMTNGTQESFKEGDQLELRCNADGGVPRGVRSYTCFYT